MEGFKTKGPPSVMAQPIGLVCSRPFSNAEVASTGQCLSVVKEGVEPPRLETGVPARTMSRKLDAKME